MYKHFNIIEHQSRIPHEYVLDTPNEPFWPQNWEWKLTEKEIFSLLWKTVRYKAIKLFLKLLEKLGCVFSQAQYLSYENKYIETEKIEKVIYDNIKSINLLYRYKVMIIFGPDVHTELTSVTQPFNFNSEFRFAYEGNKCYYFFHDIPMFFFPHIQGIHVIPDMTGQWKERVEQLEETSFRKFQRQL